MKRRKGGVITSKAPEDKDSENKRRNKGPAGFKGSHGHRKMDTQKKENEA